MHPIIKTILYGLGVFVIFTILAVILKLVTKKIPENAEYFGLITNGDVMIGLVVAMAVTISHERKKKIM